MWPGRPAVLALTVIATSLPGWIGAVEYSPAVHEQLVLTAVILTGTRPLLQATKTALASFPSETIPASIVLATNSSGPAASSFSAERPCPCEGSVASHITHKQPMMASTLGVRAMSFLLAAQARQCTLRPDHHLVLSYPSSQQGHDQQDHDDGDSAAREP